MQIVIFFVRIGAAKRIVVFQMQTDTKEVSKWKSRVEKDQQQTHQCKAQKYHQRWRKHLTITACTLVTLFILSKLLHTA